MVVEEIRQSLGLAEQCLERLDRLGSDVIAVEGLERGEPSVPAGAGECSVESSNGELGFYVVSDGGERPLRVRCRAPSFLLAQALPQTLVGESLDDLLPIVASMRLLCPEIDR